MKSKIQIRDYDTCPHCGTMVHIWGKDDKFYIVCDNCELKTDSYEDIRDAIMNWERIRGAEENNSILADAYKQRDRWLGIATELATQLHEFRKSIARAMNMEDREDIISSVREIINLAAEKVDKEMEIKDI